MGFFARAVVSGFAFSLGKALFDKVKDHIGLGDTDAQNERGGVTQVEDIGSSEDDTGQGMATELESLDDATLH